MRRWLWLPCACLFSAVLSADGPTMATGKDLQRQYVGSYDTDALLREPLVSDELQRLLGAELPHFLANLNVRGSVDLVSGALSLSGNAVHYGGEEEAVLCVAAYDGAVSAAILSGGAISIYSSAPDYQSQNLCIKDWITQVNSGHRDRFAPPSNVKLVVPP